MYINIYKTTNAVWYKKVNKKEHKKEGKFARGKRLQRFSPRPIKRRFPFLFYYFATYTTNLSPDSFLFVFYCLNCAYSPTCYGIVTAPYESY